MMQKSVPQCMAHSLKDKMEVNNAVPLPRQMPTMPTGHLFDLCPQSYWLSLEAAQLVRWIHAISWYITDPNEEWGLAWTLGDAEVDFAGSGHVFEDFEGKTFAETDLYDFLCWASQRLVSLGQGDGRSLYYETPETEFFRMQTREQLWAIVEAEAFGFRTDLSLSDAYEQLIKMPFREDIWFKVFEASQIERERVEIAEMCLMQIREKLKEVV